jgi:hypothetical protein
MFPAKGGRLGAGDRKLEGTVSVELESLTDQFTVLSEDRARVEPRCGREPRGPPVSGCPEMPGWPREKEESLCRSTNPQASPGLWSGRRQTGPDRRMPREGNGPAQLDAEL